MKTVVGLDFGSDTLKAVVAQGRNVVSTVSIPAPPGAVQRAQVHDPQAVAYALAGALGRNARHAYGCTVVPSSAALVRLLALPGKLGYKHLRQIFSIPQQVLSLIPSLGNPEQHAFDWQIVGHDQGKTTVAVGAVPAAVLDQHKKVMELLGLVPLVVETEVTAFLAALGEPAARGTRVAAILGADAGTTIVYRDGLPLAVHVEHHLGGYALDRQLAEELGYSLEECRNLRESEGTGLQCHAMDAWLDAVAAAVRGAVFYASSQGGAVDQVILAGGMAAMPGLAGALAGALGLDVAIPAPGALAIADPVHPGLLACLGAAARGVESL